MPVSQDYINYILDQLSEFGEVQSKKMFGGVGFFREGKMFAMLAGDTFRLKVDDTNKPDFEAKGMQPYVNPKKKKGMPYWEVPPDVLEDKTLLAEWAMKSWKIAMGK